MEYGEVLVVVLFARGDYKMSLSTFVYSCRFGFFFSRLGLWLDLGDLILGCFRVSFGCAAIPPIVLEEGMVV